MESYLKKDSQSKGIFSDEKGSTLLVAVYIMFFFSVCILYVSSSYITSFEISKDLQEKERMNAVSSYIFMELKKSINKKEGFFPINTSYSAKNYNISYKITLLQDVFQCIIVLENKRGMKHTEIYKWKVGE